MAAPGYQWLPPMTKREGKKWRSPRTPGDGKPEIDFLNEKLLPLRFTKVDDSRDENLGKPNFPRIILKDALGNKLDTFTYLQEAIYRAEWNVKQTHEAITPEEWRLPKAPIPARPDYSRTAPMYAKKRHRMKHNQDSRLSKSLPCTRVREIDVDDVAFVAESLNNLPSVPSLSFLHRELLAEPKKYFQIVQQMLLEHKYYSKTDKRSNTYNFPGFCTGCRRMGLCYGCERSSEPHYHTDQIMKTGGGFTYFRKDRPENELLSKHPSNWKLMFPEIALKRLMEDGGINIGSLDMLHEEGDSDDHDLTKSSLLQQRYWSVDSSGTDLPVVKVVNEFAVNNMTENKSRLSNNKQVLADNGSDEDADVMDKTLMDKAKMRYHLEDHRSSQSNMKNDDSINVSPWEDRLMADKDSINDLIPRKETHTGLSSTDVSNIPTSGSHDAHVDVPVDGNHGDQDRNTDIEDNLGGHDDSRTQTTAGRESRWTRKTLDTTDTDISYDSGTHNPAESGDESDSGSPSGSQRKRRLYKDRESWSSSDSSGQSPPAFKLKQRKHRSTSSRSPFSTDRKYDIPKGGGIQIKKSDKKPTQIQEFKQHDGNWKEPEKFVVKKSEKSSTRFWSPRKDKNQGQKKERSKKIPRPVSPDSGLESEKPSDSVQELPLIPPPVVETERALSPPLQKVSSPETSFHLPPIRTPSPVVERPKKEKVKKTKKQPIQRTSSPIRSPSPVKSPVQETEEPPIILKTPEPEEHVPTPTIPELPPLDIPPLPQIIEEKKEHRLKIDTRKSIQPMPKIKDALPPPPKKSKVPNIPKSKYTPKKRLLSAEAPVTTEEIKEMKDPLDFLAKYCIISKDRLPYYENVYNKIVSHQPDKYERAHPLSPITGMPVKEATTWGNHELNMFHDLILISRSQEPQKPGLNAPEQYLEKICYTVEMLEAKHKQLEENLHKLQAKRFDQLAERAKSLVPDIASVHFKTKGAKKAKKKKKKKKGEPETPEVVLTKADITSEVIVGRLNEKLLKKLMKEPAQYQLTCEIDRCAEKLANTEDRLIQLQGEKNIMGMYCMEIFFNSQNDNHRPVKFRRQQSMLYQTLHPDPDIEMNREEIEGALQIINNNLLSNGEFSYLYHILNLPGRPKINFKLFCVIAALSEKITHMDPVIKELLNKEKGWPNNDYEALNVKMDQSKELFQLLENGDTAPHGNVLASSLAVELAAGGLSQEVSNHVMSKFNREGKGYVDFLDYVTYVPLFIEIHKRIISDPLRTSVQV